MDSAPSQDVMSGFAEGQLFPHAVEPAGGSAMQADGRRARSHRFAPKMARGEIRGIQDLIWKEAVFALRNIGDFADDAAFQDFLRQHLPQNSQETRTRYAQSLMRWFFPDGIRGLAAQVWINYRDQSLADEILRYLYLREEPILGTTVAEALFPIAENAAIPASYLNKFLATRFDNTMPAKSINRAKANLRKLNVLSREKGNRDTLRALSPSPTGFFILLHHIFAFREAGGIEFRTLVENPFWKYLGFKSEDRLRAMLKEGVAKSILAKYVVADRIESISFQHTFSQFVTGGLRA